ncbi:MAG: CPBP family intramembrane metalloprotease [Candidatus Izemoplasmatales bacterium]|nr:CPBP family intramembrane metalloprotease [Candidatus Izemoplasmatales bacterium]
MDHLRKHKKKLLFFGFLLLLLLTFGLIVGGYVFEDPLSPILIRDTSIRMLIGFVLIIAMVAMGYPLFAKPLVSGGRILLIIIPALIVAINNFPISAYFEERAILSEPSHTLILFALECLSIGFLEEVVFRGIILIALLDRAPQTKSGRLLAIIGSAAIFGLVHLFNLTSGAGIQATFLQVGYSFLMGAMWAVVYIATKNLFFPIMLHALYNFAGQVFLRLGTVTNQFDTVTILVTVAIALLTIGFYVHIFLRLRSDDYERLLQKN